MNINSFEKFKAHIYFYQFWYVFLSILVLTSLILCLFLSRHVYELEYEGIIQDNLLIIKNLDAIEINNIINCSKMMIQDKDNKKEIIDILEVNNKYYIKLQLDNDYKEQETLKVKFIIASESLFQFIKKSITS